jgi:hyaluronoglucosaminidase
MLPPGVIEGFYGRQWSWEERRQMVGFLAGNGFGSYWYAPKGDANLRREWASNWNNETATELASLATLCREKEITFGIGISPLGLYPQWESGGRQRLLDRLVQIRDIHPGGIAILFDDMLGDLPNLARMQSEIAHLVAEHTGIGQVIVCPSYYSHDPILEQLFGSMPQGYWDELGQQLDPSIGIFWTGDKVISPSYPQGSLEEITERFRRKPVLWDNSIVNDGRKTSPFLNLRPMYRIEELGDSAERVLVNPMNAPALSQLVLLTLMREGDGEARLRSAMKQLAPLLCDALLQVLPLLNEKGLEQLTPADEALLRSLFSCPSHPVAAEIIRWLEGAYRFDPACLT